MLRDRALVEAETAELRKDQMIGDHARTLARLQMLKKRADAKGDIFQRSRLVERMSNVANSMSQLNAVEIDTRELMRQEISYWKEQQARMPSNLLATTRGRRARSASLSMLPWAEEGEVDGLTAGRESSKTFSSALAGKENPVLPKSELKELEGADSGDEHTLWCIVGSMFAVVFVAVGISLLCLAVFWEM
jgi:hypothetical protein